MQIITPSGVTIEGDATNDAIKVRQVGDESGGAYLLSARTGLVATPSAGGNLLQFRWNHPSKLFVLDLLRVRAMFTTSPTAAQEWGLDAIVVRDTSSTSGGGTVYNNLAIPRKRATYPPSALMGVSAVPSTSGAFFIATTTTLSTGGGTQDASEFMSDMAWELAPLATVPHSKIFMEKDYTQGQDSPLIFSKNEGFVVRNLVLVGAGGVLRASFEVAWHEVEPDWL